MNLIIAVHKEALTRERKKNAAYRQKVATYQQENAAYQQEIAELRRLLAFKDAQKI
jgi:hypothetical protein